MQPVDLDMSNTAYLEELYAQYQRDPGSLSPEWSAFFKGFDTGYWSGEERAPASFAAPAAPPAGERRSRQRTERGVFALVNAYRQQGHFAAALDPLGHSLRTHPLLELSEFGLSEAELERGVGPGGFLGKTDGTLRDLIARLRATYCRSLGVDFMGIDDKEQRTWLQERIEPILNRTELAREQSLRLLGQLIETEEFEHFLHTRYLGQKRFSIEGGEALLPLLDTLIETGAGLGVEEMVIGMAHRGRLNVLAHILHKPYEVILSEFEGAAEGAEQEGDVKYHQGYSYDHVTKRGCKIHLSLSSNPSHLELVNPVIEGIVRAKQDYLHDAARGRVVPVQIHGEAAFTGQGIVAETLNLSQLEGYQNGGTVHIIINNQLGYTATPQETRFTPYPTDVARQIQAPVFHVNADDPEAVLHAGHLAIEFRSEFKRDVLIDLWCYRRHGHNEADDPTLTQPLMYQEIARHPSVCEIYGEKLIGAGALTQEDAGEMRRSVRETLERCQEKARRLRAKPRTSVFGGVWQGLTWAGEDWDIETGVAARTLRKIAARATAAPEGFTLHRTVQRLVEGRREMVEGKRPVDWGCAEMLALGSLLLERIPVRLSGQDSQRGTFAHRHALWHDVASGEQYTPLAHLGRVQGEFVVLNTMLSELAVLGFEYGISSADPRRLLIWEAQFGDFVNGAQLVIDQYLSSAEAKWNRMSGLVLLLPHGYEGMGPEHSSARLERFLQLCAKDNMQVCYPTTPAQIFHLLRRQMHRSFRKPLIVMAPKSLLRHKLCVSPIDAFTRGGFYNVLDDAAAGEAEAVRRLVLCSGKIYYELLAARREREVDGVALVRLEQLYPFPASALRRVVEGYARIAEVFWVQEEARNMGAWHYVQPLLDELLPRELELRYVGRDEAASPAVGDYAMHQREERQIVEEALEAHGKQVVLAGVERQSPRQVSGQAGTKE